jgi:V/A-type H+-transporting ATPase subunit D
MTEASITRAAVLEMKDEQRAMHEGYVFLDEKCLLLAGEILRELARYGAIDRELVAAQQAATVALQAALARHGLDDLQLYPPLEQGDAMLARESRSIMGVRLQDVDWQPARQAAPASVQPSPEAEACRRAYVALIAAAARLAAISGNLERLSREYQRSVRRARALQDVLLPELDQQVRSVETRLEELEQEDAISMRRFSAQGTADAGGCSSAA